MLYKLLILLGLLCLVNCSRSRTRTDSESLSSKSDQTGFQLTSSDIHSNEKYIFRSKFFNKLLGYDNSNLKGSDTTVSSNNEFTLVGANNIYCLKTKDNLHIKMTSDGAVSLTQPCLEWEKFEILNAPGGFYLKSVAWGKLLNITNVGTVMSNDYGQDWEVFEIKRKKIVPIGDIFVPVYKLINPVPDDNLPYITIQDSEENNLSGASISIKPCESCPTLSGSTDSLGRFYLGYTDNFDEKYLITMNKTGFHSRTVVSSRSDSPVIKMSKAEDANPYYYDIKKEYDLLSHSLPFSEAYQKTRKRFIDKFLYDGAIAKSHKTDSQGNRSIKFGDQTFYQGFALVNFAVEYRILKNKANLDSVKSNKIVGEIISEMEYLESHGYQPHEDGFLIRDKIPINGTWVWNAAQDDGTISGPIDNARRPERPLNIPEHIMIKMSDFSHGNSRNKEMSIDQATLILIGLWAVNEFMDDQDLKNRARTLANKVWFYIKNKNFLITLPISSTPVMRGSDAQTAGYTLSRIAGQSDSGSGKFYLFDGYNKEWKSHNPFHPIGPDPLKFGISFDPQWLYISSIDIGNGMASRLNGNRSLKNLNIAPVLAQLTTCMGWVFDGIQYSYNRVISAVPQLADLLGLDKAPSCSEVMGDIFKDIFGTDLHLKIANKNWPFLKDPIKINAFAYNLALLGGAFNDHIQDDTFEIISTEPPVDSPYPGFRGHMVAEFIRAKHLNKSPRQNLIDRSRGLLNAFPWNKEKNALDIPIHAGPHDEYHSSLNPVWHKDNRWERHGEDLPAGSEGNEYTGIDFMLLEVLTEYFAPSYNSNNTIRRDYIIHEPK